MYGLLVGPLRRRLAPGASFPARQASFFYAALTAFYLAEGSPLHDLAERYLFSAHMAQHILLSYAVAPSSLSACRNGFCARCCSAAPSGP